MNVSNVTNTTQDRCSSDSDGGVDPQAMIGVGLAMFSAFISSVALLIMKWSAEVEGKEQNLPLRKRWRWWLGFIMNTTSELSLSTVALALAPLLIIAPVFGMQVIFSALLAWSGCVPGVKETLSSIEWACLVMAFTGIALCSVFGPSSSDEIEYAEYQDYFVRWQFLGYLLPCVLIVISWLCVLLCPCLRPFRPPHESLTTSIFSALGAGIAGSFSIVCSRIFMTGLVWRLIAAGDTGVLTMWITWVGITGLILCAPTQLWLLNHALGSGKAAFTVPLYTCLVTVNNIVQGGLLFDEFYCLAQRSEDLLVFLGAILLVLIGVAILSSQQERKKGRQLGLQWRESLAKGASGTELVNEALAEALRQRTQFTPAELAAFQLPDVTLDSYIMVDGRRFRPAGPEGNVGANAIPNALPAAGPGAMLATVVIESEKDESSLARFASRFGLSTIGKLPSRLTMARASARMSRMSRTSRMSRQSNRSAAEAEEGGAGDVVADEREAQGPAPTAEAAESTTADTSAAARSLSDEPEAEPLDLEVVPLS